jgi:hypothetical protein
MGGMSFSVNYMDMLYLLHFVHFIIVTSFSGVRVVPGMLLELLVEEKISNKFSCLLAQTSFCLVLHS